MYRMNVIDIKSEGILRTEHYTNLIIAEKMAIEIEQLIPNVLVTIYECEDEHSPSGKLIKSGKQRVTDLANEVKQ